MNNGAGSDTATVALVGNPNTGKSTLFGALLGVRQRVGNYPGVTVDKEVGRLERDGQSWTLIDLPGTYSLAPRSPDEMVAIDVLLGRDGVPAPDVVLCVIDASNLERNLYLVSQVLELGRPAVVALTMKDVAHEHGVEIDVDRLARRLGLPVVPVRADRGIGLEVLWKALTAAAGGAVLALRESLFPASFCRETDQLAEVLDGNNGHRLGGPLPRYLVERLLLDTSGYFERYITGGGDHRVHDALRAARSRLADEGCPVPAVEAVARYGWVAHVVEGALFRPAEYVPTLSDRIDVVLTHRVWGTLILAVVMLSMFNAVFTWAEVPMGWVETGVAALAGLVEKGMPEGALRSLLAEGVIGGIGSVIMFLPQIAILFFFLAMLEECGYLARAAFLMDRMMARLGLSGRSFIPLLSSFACAIPGVMAARVIESRRDRLTTILIAPFMSCSARLPVYTLMTAAFIPARSVLGGLVGLRGLTLFAMYAVGIVAAAATAAVLKRSLLREETPPFVMELPPYRWPSPVVVAHRVVERAWDFLHSAGTLILSISVVMWAALYYPRLPASEAAPYLAERQQIEATQGTADPTTDQAAALASIDGRLHGAQRRQSLLGRTARWVEPLFQPLGWDWRIGSAVLASFPAREVVVASLGVVFDAGKGDDAGRLDEALRAATWEGTQRPLFNIPVALSVMVFFALCAQCASTLTVMRRETGSWIWPAFSFLYMTSLAYVAALVVYQVGIRLLAGAEGGGG
jgi:ferrous iron transport protein B